MKNFNKNIVAVLLMATALAGCGNGSETSENTPKIKEIPTEQVSTTEATTVATTIPIEDRKPKVNNFTMSYIDEGVEFEHNYCFVPEEATELSDDINLGLITVDGKEFDITNLANAYGEEEIKNVFGVDIVVPKLPLTKTSISLVFK